MNKHIKVYGLYRLCRELPIQDGAIGWKRLLNHIAESTRSVRFTYGNHEERRRIFFNAQYGCLNQLREVRIE